MAENIVGKGENAGYKHFLLFPQCFQNPSDSGRLKSAFSETSPCFFISAVPV